MRPSRNRQLSGRYWVSWIDRYAPTSKEIKDLDMMFGKKVKEFKYVLEDAGVKVKVEHTYRSEQAAYLWHWAWRIAQRKVSPKAVPRYTKSSPVPDIEWDHGNLADSIKGAEEMLKGFNLSAGSKYPPSLTTRHLGGFAVDMIITWSGMIRVKKKGGPEVPVSYMSDVDANKALHEIGASYGVHKLIGDPEHWSSDGR